MRQRDFRLRSRSLEILDGCTLFNLISIFLAEGRVPHSRAQLANACWSSQGEEHSLSYVAKLLDRVGIGTSGYYLASRRTHQLTPPLFCFLTRHPGRRSLAIVLRRYKDGVVVHEGAGEAMAMSRREFAAVWDGVALVTEGATDQLIADEQRGMDERSLEQFRASFGLKAGFLDASECDEIVGQASRHFQRSVVGRALEVSPVRTSQSAYLNSSLIPMQASIFDRARQLVSDAELEFEDLQVVRYGPGESYQCHFDVDMHSPPGQSSAFGLRKWTILVYLTDDFVGGETRFPLFGESIAPRKGAALYFRNYTDEENPNPFALHTGTPVRSGAKFAMNVWSK
ncbi:prolyl hydroxylase family protein [Luteimonas sp. R10]|uniref:prolyl hydroxylase family protein n=1 Tax=Luteimonas sp. R10 TaxID=3108176 RepID=UPI0030928FC8|nr:2OG-Fe(II) oxygenase [Luteimonas sp. R10]